MDYAVTRTVIRNLFKVMAIKDEVYVAHLLTAPEKRERDFDRYNVDLKRGDHVQYIHLNRPRFSIGPGDIEFDMNSRNWMLNIMKHLKWLRAVLPTWHKKEKGFRDWYLLLIQQFNYHENEVVYRQHLNLFSLPESVSGYREIRAPKIDEARAKAEQIQAAIQSIQSQSSSSMADTHNPS